MPTSATLWTPWIETAVAWLLTYFVHSSLLLGAAFVLSRALPDRFLPAREMAWRTALVAGLLTATLQVGLAITPLAGAWRIDLNERAVPRVATAPAALSAGGTAAGPLQVRAAERTTLVPASVTPSASTPRLTWFDLAIAGWLAVATLLVALLATSYRRLARRLGSRRTMRHGPLVSMLDRLIDRAGARSARLASSDRISVPLARGIRQREICLPERMLDEMSVERQEIVLAHELAHLERRDPAWLLGMRLLESLLFFQPLNRLARHELQEIAEYRCDDWAVARTGRPVTMARCLTDVASWSLDRRPAGLVPTMAVDGSRLGRRVSRLLSRDYPSPAAETPRWLGAAALAVVAVVVAAAPGVSRATASDPGERQVVVLSDEIDSGERGETSSPADDPAVWVEAEPVTDVPPAAGTSAADSSDEAPAAAPLPPAPPTPPTASVTTPEPPTPPAAPHPVVTPETAPEPPEAEELRLEMELLMESLDSEILVEMEAIQAELELELEAIEIDMEPIRIELEALTERIESDFADLDGLELSPDEMPIPDAETLERIAELSARIAEAYQPNEEQLRRLAETASEYSEQVTREIERVLDEIDLDAIVAHAEVEREAARHQLEESRAQREAVRHAVESARAERERAEHEIELSRQESERARQEVEVARQEAEAARLERERARQEAELEAPESAAPESGPQERESEPREGAPQDR